MNINTTGSGLSSTALPSALSSLNSTDVFSSTQFISTIVDLTTGKSEDEHIVPTYTTSITILTIVTIVAALTLLVFAAATFRYCCAHRGTYLLREFPLEDKKKRSDIEMTSNVHEEKPIREWML